MRNDLPRPLGQAWLLFAVAGGASLLDRLFDRLTGFTGAFLNAPQQLLAHSFGILEIVVGQLGPLLLQFSLGDVPVALDFEFCHDGSFVSKHPPARHPLC